MLRTVLFLTLTALVAGCATEAERSAQIQREVDEMITVYGPACDKLGYQKNSDRWRDCILRMSNRDTIAHYGTAPTTTTCFGHRGFFHCSTF